MAFLLACQGLVFVIASCQLFLADCDLRFSSNLANSLNETSSSSSRTCSMPLTSSIYIFTD